MDPDGEVIWLPIVAGIGAVLGAVVSVATVAVGDVFIGETSSLGAYAGAAIGGATTGAILATTGNSVVAGAAGATAGNATSQLVDGEEFDFVELTATTAVGAATGLIPGSKISGVTSGKGSMAAVSKQVNTKLANGTIQNISTKTSAKIATSRSSQGALLEGTIASPFGSELIDRYKPDSANSQNYDTNKDSSELHITNGETQVE